jgi:hypothetical protein
MAWHGELGTISRIESRKHTATVRVFDKLDKAIRKARERRGAGAHGGGAKSRLMP